MITKALRSKALIALAVPLLAAGFTYAGGAHCHGKAVAEASGMGAHCPLHSKDITKTFELTDDGAVVTLVGKTDKAVEHIKAHFAKHQEGEACPGCPLDQDGISATFEVTNDGGTITAAGSTPETVKAVQDWAKAPAGQCCMGGGKA